MAEETKSKRVARPYAVLEQGRELDVLHRLLELASVSITDDEWELIEKVATGVAYVEVDRPTARNATHALTQTGQRLYDSGRTPPLVAIPERQFRPKRLDVQMRPKVSVA